MKVFSQYSLDTDLMKTSGVHTFAKKVYLCQEHIKRYNQFKVIKELIQLNSLSDVQTGKKTD